MTGQGPKLAVRHPPNSVTPARAHQQCRHARDQQGSYPHRPGAQACPSPGQLTPLEQPLHQPLPGGQAAGVVGGHPPQQRLGKAALDRLWLLGGQSIQLRLDGRPLCFGGARAGGADKSVAGMAGAPGERGLHVRKCDDSSTGQGSRDPSPASNPPAIPHSGLCKAAGHDPVALAPSGVVSVTSCSSSWRAARSQSRREKMNQMAGSMPRRCRASVTAGGGGECACG